MGKQHCLKTQKWSFSGELKHAHPLYPGSHGLEFLDYIVQYTLTFYLPYLHSGNIKLYCIEILYK